MCGDVVVEYVAWCVDLWRWLGMDCGRVHLGFCGSCLGILVVLSWLGWWWLRLLMVSSIVVVVVVSVVVVVCDDFWVCFLV